MEKITEYQTTSDVFVDLKTETIELAEDGTIYALASGWYDNAQFRLLVNGQESVDGWVLLKAGTYRVTLQWKRDNPETIARCREMGLSIQKSNSVQ